MIVPVLKAPDPHSVEEDRRFVRLKKARSYGADDQQPCPVCNARMFIARRTPHPTIADGEMQTFSCMKCEEQICRSVNSNGDVIV